MAGTDAREPPTPEPACAECGGNWRDKKGSTQLPEIEGVVGQK